MNTFLIDVSTIHPRIVGNSSSGFRPRHLAKSGSTLIAVFIDSTFLHNCKPALRNVFVLCNHASFKELRQNVNLTSITSN